MASEPIDWKLASRVARSVAGGGPPTTRQMRDAVRRDFDEVTRRSDELVRDFTHIESSPEPAEALVVDRGGWVDANITSFKDLIAPLTEKISTASTSAVTRRLVGGALGVQVGVLLGYLSQKVLGQYDLMLATGGAGRVYYVGPNVLESEHRFGIDPHDFRLWIAIHEVTHRAQFTGVPWLRERVRSLISNSLGAMDLDAARMKQIADRAKGLLAGGPAAWKKLNVMDLLLSAEQRVVMAEVQALMTIVEGHGTFVMNRVGAVEIASYAQMQGMLEQRRARTKPAEKAFQRAIGMDMKYEQYALGEKFLNEVADIAGVDAVNKVWERDGENIPTLDEMRAPTEWLKRIE